MERTLKNLAKAFIGESQARNRYRLYSQVAKNEGYEQIADLFLLTAENEWEHAEWLFRLMQDLRGKCPKEVKALNVEAEVPLGYGNTIANLQAAIEGEDYENTVMYPEFAKVAEEEGLTDIAARLRAIGTAEAHHRERYQKLLKEVKNGTVWKKEEEVEWVCRKCGYVHKGKTPPEECPSCGHSSNYYERKCETY
ncbi:MAG: hypothetical protein PWQ88_666 [Candidatus Methanomethylophilaceae archaeon]|nr:hypothetical protein [Candidatus Methanomethylophilaceae archaeon]MDI3542243.1 hypothetical protein [Candidatus Methanomethylophilaceae archaeon]HIJ00894.1 rubrerythrin family protein [Candidatus Methanomethylophilaceae archaeon]